jgi:HSP20 family protein
MTLIRWKPVHQLASWNPFNISSNDLFNIHREFDRVRGGEVADDSSATWLPAVDILEEEGSYKVRVELPGVSKDDVKVTVQNDILTIRGEKKMEAEKKNDNYRRVERAYGSFLRSFSLPTSVNAGAIEASHENGILTLTLPKLEEAKPKQIEVKIK